MGAGYALVAVGFSIIYSTTRTFHFAHGATYAIAAYGYYAVVVMAGLNPAIGVIVSCALATGFGVAVDAFIYRPMRRTKASFLTLFAASFGILIVVTNGLTLIFGNKFYSIDSPLSQGIEFGPSIIVSTAAILQIVVALALTAGLIVVINRTRLGTFLKAMHDSNELVEVYGFNSRRYASSAFFIGSLFVVPAAIMGTYIGGITPGTATMITLVAIASTIIGGIGSVAGAALGGFILGISENVGIWHLSSSWKPAISFGVLLLFLLLRPAGLVGDKVRRA